MFGDPDVKSRLGPARSREPRPGTRPTMLEELLENAPPARTRLIRWWGFQHPPVAAERLHHVPELRTQRDRRPAGADHRLHHRPPAPRRDPEHAHCPDR